MFSLFNRMMCGILNRFRISKRVMAVCLMMAVAVGGIWAQTKYAWYTTTGDWSTAGSWMAGYSNGSWDKPSTTVPSSTIQTIYINTNDNTATDDGGNNIVINLTADVSLPNCTITIESKNARNVTINLNGYSFSAKNIILGNPDSSKDETVNFNINGTGSFSATTLDYKNKSTDSSLNVTNGATITLGSTTKSGGKDISISKDTASTITVTGTNNIGTPTETDTVTWTGGTGNWETPANWTPHTTNFTNVNKIVIPSGHPTASENIVLGTSSTLEIASGATATFNGDATLSTVTLGSGTGTTLECLGNTTITSLDAPADSILKFNQGTGAQTTTIDAMTFAGDEVNFGNDADDVFNMGSAGDIPLDISGVTTATLAGKINSSTLTLNASPSLAADTILSGQAVLSDDIHVTGAYLIAFQKEITGTTYSFSSDASSTWFRGDVSVKSLTFTDEVQFLGSVSTITTSEAQVYQDLVTNRNITLLAGNNTVTITGTLDSWDSTPRSFTVGNATNTTSLSVNGKIGEIKPIGDITVAGDFSADSDIIADSIAVEGASTFGTSTITTTGSQTYTGAVTLKDDATFAAGTNKVTFSSTVDCDSTAKVLTIGATGAANKTEVEFGGKAGSIKPLKTLTHYGDVTLTDDITLASWNNINDSTITPGTSTVYVNDAGEFTGSNTFYNLTINGTAAGKTITFEADKTQTVTGTFTVEGTSASNITLNSSDDDASPTQWKIDAANADVSYVQVKNSNSTNLISAKYSTYLGNNINWAIGATYKWNGTTADWTVSSNWLIEQGTDNWITTTLYPGEASVEDTVTISTTAAADVWPVFSGASDITLKSIAISDADAKVTIASSGNIVLTDTDPLSNDGTIIFKDDGRFLDGTTPIMDVDSGTAEYAGASVITNYNMGASANNDYFNLVISSDTTLPNNHKIRIVKNFTLTASITNTDGQSIYVGGESSISTNLTTLHDQEYNGAVTLKAASIELKATTATYKTKFNKTVTSTVSGGTALTVNDVNFTRPVTNLKTLTVEKTATIGTGASITTSGLQTYTGAVTNNGTINVPPVATASDAIIFNSDYTGGTLIGNATTDPNIVFAGGTVTLGTFTHNDDVVKFTENSDINFDANGQTLKDVTIETNSTSLTFASAITANDITFTNGTVSLPSTVDAANININGGSITAAADSSITVSGDWAHTAGTFTPATSTVTVTGNVSGTNSFNNLILSGNLSGAHTLISSLTVEGTGTTLISDSNTFDNFTCTTASKTLNFGSGETQTVNTLFKVTGGTTAGQQINIQSSTAGTQWTLDISDASKVEVTKVLLKDSESTFAKVTATNSRSLGNNTNWALAQDYIWTGANDNNWINPQNWEITYLGTSYTADDFPGATSTADTVTIDAATNEPTFPQVTADTQSITVKSLEINNASRVLTINNSGDITVTDDTITNKGKIIYSSTGRIKNDDASPLVIMDATQGTVQFEGTAATIDDISSTDTDNDYNNIIINSDVTLGGNIKAKGTLSLDTGVTISGSSNALSIEGTSSIAGNITGTSSQNYTGNVTLKNDVILESAAGTVTIAGKIDSDSTARSLTVGATGKATELYLKKPAGSTSPLNNIEVYGKMDVNTGTITCSGDLTCRSGTTFRGAVNANSIYVNGTTTIGTATSTITTTGTRATYGSQYFNDAVGVNGDTTFTVPSGDNVTFNSTLNSYSANQFKAVTISGGAVFNKTVGGTANQQLKSLSVSETTTLGANCEAITTSETQDFSDNVTFAHDLTLSGSTITAAKDFTSSPAKALTIASGTFNMETGAFTSDKLTVSNGASFIQTGINTGAQSVSAIENNGTMIWDSAAEGGTLTVSGDITQADTDHLVVFNNKNLTLNTSTISGIFYDLTIPAGETITNGLKIVVLHDLTINGTYIHNDNELHLGAYTMGATTYHSGTTPTAEGVISGTTTPLNLGNLVITQEATTKTFKNNTSLITLTADDISSTAGKIVFEKNLTVTNATTLTTKGSIAFASTATSDSSNTTDFQKGISITQSSEVSVGGTLQSSVSGGINIPGAIKLLKSAIVKTTNGAITLGPITQTSQDNLKITPTAGAITLGGNISVNKLDITNPTSLAINNACATVTATTGFALTGSGTVSLGGTPASLTISTTNSDISFGGTGTVTLVKNLSLSTSTGAGNVTLDQPFQATAANTQTLTINAGSGNINLQSNIGNQTALGTVTITGKDTTLSTSKQIKAYAVSVNNSGVLLMEESSDITAVTGFTKTGTGLSQIAGTIKTTNSPISFSSSTYIYKTATLNSGTKDISIGTTTGDLYISALESASAAGVDITAGTLSVAENFALFNGNVSLKSNLTTGKDIVLLNGQTSSIYKDNDTGITDLYDYHNSKRTAANNLCPPSITTFPTEMPDTTTAIDHTEYKASLTDFGSKTITAGQNFYTNGVDLTPAAGWTLSLKGNDDATASFAEAHNAKIKNCSVSAHDGTFAWLSASESCTDEGSNSTDTDATVNYTTGVNTGSYTRTPAGIAFLKPMFLIDEVASRSASEGRKTGPEIPNLSGTYSVRDNVIRVEFVRSNYVNGNSQPQATALIENSNNEISKAVSQIKYNGGTKAFTGSYIDAECTETTDGKGDIAVFYIQVNTNADKSLRWQLDATGVSTGNQGDSDGSARSNYTDLQIEKATGTIFSTLTDDHKNRIIHYKGTVDHSTARNEKGFTFSATTSRCVIGGMHITFTVADFVKNEVYMYFDNPVDFENITWEDPAVATKGAIQIITDPNQSSGNKNVDKVERISGNDYGIKLILSSAINYADIEKGFIIKYGGSFLFNNKIHSADRKVVLDGETHCISDVITDCIDVQYAYDNRNDTYIDTYKETASADSIAIRDFSGESKHNRVFADKNITLVTKDIAERSDPDTAEFTYKLIADITPSQFSQGTVFESYSGHKTRFWFADGNAPVSTFSSAINTSTNKKDSVNNSDLITQSSNGKTGLNYIFHNFSEEDPCLNWKSGSDVRFLFEALKTDGTPYKINHKYDAAKTEVTPLYVARLKNPADPTSIDLWSFKIQEPQRQRGGVSIYSNVVNATAKEYCTVEVNMPKTGSLRVIVMTADGNVVKYLENGRQSQGLHYYYWNGTNNSGKTVARGIYFIRVVGPDIEETRKVMVVKD